MRMRAVGLVCAATQQQNKNAHSFVLYIQQLKLVTIF